MILGIVGGALGCVSGISFILMGCFFGSSGLWDFAAADGFPAHVFTNLFLAMYLVFGILALIAGVLGLTGGLLVKKKEKTAGVLLIIGAALSFSVPLILAAIFAFVKEKAPAPAYGCPPPYPYPPQYTPYPSQYAPYPPQYTPYPPQQTPYPSQQTPSAPAGGIDPPDGDPQA